MEETEKNLPKVIISFKEVGETPLEVIDTLKRETDELKGVPITYAGRLDPMAEGVLLLLIGDEVHSKEDYLKLDKVYSFEVLFGFSTDTFDVLGKITDSEDGTLSESAIENAVKKVKGIQTLYYPPYSSKTVDGKPLFKWAREGRLHEITLPSRSVKIKKLIFEEIYKIGVEELLATINSNIDKVNGDFRQEEIKELWSAYIENSMMEEFQVGTFTLECSSGTYVRAIVDELSNILDVPATTFHIKRVSVGDYRVEE